MSHASERRGIDSLAERWRGEAGAFRRRGLEQFAALVDSFADEVEAALRDGDTATVGLTEAARLSDYNVDSLGRMIRDGRLENLGTRTRPRVRVVDLPRKPGCASGPDGRTVLPLKGAWRGLEKAVERRRVRVQRGGDAS